MKGNAWEIPNQVNSIQFNSIQFNSIQFNSIQLNSIKVNVTGWYFPGYALVCVFTNQGFVLLVPSHRRNIFSVREGDTCPSALKC